MKYIQVKEHTRRIKETKDVIISDGGSFWSLGVKKDKYKAIKVKE